MTAASIEKALVQASGLPITRIRSMDQVVAESTARSRFDMWLMTVFGGSALLLSAIGVYGLMAYSVQQRTGEIGIRILMMVTLLLAGVAFVAVWLPAQRATRLDLLTALRQE